MTSLSSKPPAPLGGIVLVVRVLLGGLFIFAAVMKLSSPAAFALSVAHFKIIPEHADHLTKLAAYAVPWIEAVCGLSLVLGLWARSAALVLTLLLAGFIAMIASTIYRDLNVSCSCFGKFEFPCSGPVGWCHIARNGVLLALALLVVWRGPGSLAIDRESTR